MSVWMRTRGIVTRPVHAARCEIGEAWSLARAVAGYKSAREELAESTEPFAASAGWETPVVLVHGAGHNGTAWATWAPRLRAAGFEHLVALEYRTGAQSVTALASDLGTRIERVRERAGTERVHAVGHSLGGFALRVWHDLLGGDETIAAGVTLGSPHRGLPIMRWPAPRSLRELRSDSELHRELSQSAVDRSHWVSIAGARDRIVRARSCELAGATNVVLDHLGHMGLLYSRTVAGHVSVELLAAEEARAAAA
jgi:pimeloyl-ACP methyl ester carboxylesterase